MSVYCATCHDWVKKGHKKQKGFEHHRAFGLGRRKSVKRAAHNVRELLPKVRGAVPDTYDLRVSGTGGGIGIGPIYDQEDESSCVAFATVNVKVWKVGAETGQFPDLSQQFVYDYGRQMNNSCPQPGMNSDWGPDVLLSVGVCPTSDYPFTDSDNCGTPSAQALTDATPNKIVSLAEITTVDDLKDTMLIVGEVQIGIPVFEEIMNVGPDGIIPMPGQNEQSIGGHEVAVVGWLPKNGTKSLVIKNSWMLAPGQPWGDNGCGYLPEAYLAMYLSGTGDGEADSYAMWDQGQPNAPPPPTPSPTPGPTPPNTDCWTTFVSDVTQAAQNNDLLGVLNSLTQLVSCLQGSSAKKRKR